MAGLRPSDAFEIERFWRWILLGVAVVAATVLGLAWFGSFVAGMDTTTVARAQVVATALATSAATVLVLLTAAYGWVPAGWSSRWSGPGLPM